MRLIVALFLLFTSYYREAIAQYDTQIAFQGINLKNFTSTECKEGVAFYENQSGNQVFAFYSYRANGFYTKHLENSLRYSQSLVNVFDYDSSIVYTFTFIDISTYNKPQLKFYNVTQNKNDGSLKKSDPDLLFNTNDSHLIGIWTKQSSIYFLLVPNDSSSAELLIYNPTVGLKKRQYHSTSKLFNKHLTKNSFSVNNSSVENSIYSAIPQQKIYPLEDRVILTIDAFNLKNNDVTDIYTLYYDSSEVRHQTLSEKIPMESSINSYYFQKYIFRLTVSEKVLRISIYDIDSLTKSKSFEYHLVDDFDFKQTDFRKLTGTSSKWKNEIKADNLFEVINKITIGYPALCVNQSKDGSLIVSIGTMYDKSDKRAWALAGGGLVGGIVAYGLMGGFEKAPERLEVSDLTLYYFNGCLSHSDLNIIRKEPELLLVERIKESEFLRTKSEGLKFSHRSIYSFGSKIHFSFLDTEKNVFHIAEFSR